MNLIRDYMRAISYLPGDEFVKRSARYVSIFAPEISKEEALILIQKYTPEARIASTFFKEIEQAFDKSHKKGT